MFEIDDLKAGSQETPEEKTLQSEKALKVDNQEMLNVDRTDGDIDGKSLNEENLWSGLWLGRAEEMKKVEDFHS